MNIRIASDIHNEFKPWEISISEKDKERTLILAGDLHPRAKSAKWLANIARSFKQIIVVLGNHDYWTDSLDRASQRLKLKLSELNIQNVNVLDRDIFIDNSGNTPVRYLGCTLWTDYNNGDSLTMLDASNNMKDFKKIRMFGGTKHLSTWDILNSHNKDKLFLENALNTNFNGYTIIVSHHAPSHKSIPIEYQTEKKYYENGAYVSNLHNWILDKPFDIWIHGHTHSSFQYEFGTGQVLCNPRGYAPNDLNPNFIEELVINLEDIKPAQKISTTDYSSWWSNMLE